MTRYLGSMGDPLTWTFLSKSDRRKHKIKYLIQEGYPQDQAVAIAYSMLPDFRKAENRRTTSKYRKHGKTAHSLQKRRARNPTTVNALIKEPKQLCEAVNQEKCEVCGEYYQATILRAGGIEKASERIRAAAARENMLGGGYRSRGPLLWMMHVLKLEKWYERHAEHCMMVVYAEQDGLAGVDLPPSIVWVDDFPESWNPLGEYGISDWKAQRIRSASQNFNQELKTLKESDPFRNYDLEPIRPEEYTIQMRGDIKELNWDLEETEEGKARKKYDLPTRTYEYKQWVKWANQAFKPAQAPPIKKGEIPF